MAISNAELGQIYSMGVGKLAWLGDDGSGTANSRQMIAQTSPFEFANQTIGLGSGVLNLSPIMIAAGQTIRNITFLGAATRSAGTHFWYALYDDGRGSTSANQLALLSQTSDNTGAGLLTTGALFSQALIQPYTTTYSGLYFIGAASVGTSASIEASTTVGTGVPFAPWGTGSVPGTAGSGLTNQAPSPSGAITPLAFILYGFVS